MADDHLSRIPTARSAHSARSRRSTSTLETLSRIYSGRYVDDAGVYMSEGELEEMAEEEEENERRLSQRLSGKPTLEDKGEAHFDAESSSGESEGTGHGDIEKGGLGRPKTREAEAEHDPKLVCPFSLPASSTPAHTNRLHGKAPMIQKTPKTGRSRRNGRPLSLSPASPSSHPCHLLWWRLR